MYWIKKVYLNGVEEALTRAEVIAACLKTAPDRKTVAVSIPYGTASAETAGKVADFFDDNKGFGMLHSVQVVTVPGN